MAFDGVFMRAMRRELLERLVGARVEKVTQPEKDEVILFLRTFDPATRHSASYRLLLSANPSFPRVHLTEEARENPQVPPNLCMLLRKHLLGARLTDIRQVGTERVLTFVFEGRTELYETTERWLILELMGRGSNLILTAGDGRIFDCLHSCDISAGSKRGLLPGLIYEMPPAQKKSYLDDAVLADDFFSGDERADRKLCALILGFSPVLAREAVFAATGGCDAVAGEFSDVQKKKLNDFLDGLRSRLATGKFEPTAVFSADGPVEFFFQPLVQYGEGFLSRRYVTCSEAAEAYFRQKASAENRRRASSDITKLLQTNIARLSRKVEAQRIELEQYGKAEEYRHYGDLLIAHLGEVKRGDEAVRVTDYLTGEPVSVRLDVRLSPTQNAQRYYKLYKKAQTAKRVLAERIPLSLEETEYLQSVLDAVQRADSYADLAEIRQELAAQGYLKKKLPPRGKQPQNASRPLSFVSSDGFPILVGRNNLQNDALTLKTAQKRDWWFHIKNYPGSHVVILCDGAKPPVQTMTEAAVLAATFSGASEASKVDVDYTEVRYVKKPMGAKPGKVIYETYETAVVSPDAALAERLRRNGEEKKQL